MLWLFLVLFVAWFWSSQDALRIEPSLLPPARNVFLEVLIRDMNQTPPTRLTASELTMEFSTGTLTLQQVEGSVLPWQGFVEQLTWQEPFALLETLILSDGSQRVFIPVALADRTQKTLESLDTVTWEGTQGQGQANKLFYIYPQVFLWDVESVLYPAAAP